jgi:hypothetical protein
MSTSEHDPDDAALEPVVAENEPHIHIPDLPLAMRLVLLFLGWLVIILGLAGLLLPGLQGILLLILGAAILSVASDTVHRWLENLLEHRPRIRQRLNSFRAKLHSRLSRRKP